MAGFFGKVPTAGDFVHRGLAPGVRPVLDRWLSRWLADAARRPDAWPEGGLSAVIEGPEAPLLLLILESRDAPGRAFPLAAVTDLNGADRAGAEAWATGAFGPLIDAVDGVIDPAALGDALDVLAPPRAGDMPLVPPLVWAEGAAPMSPQEAMTALF